MQNFQSKEGSEFFITKRERTGVISHLGREVIFYNIEIPNIEKEGFPNALFEETAENYLKYLEIFAEESFFEPLEKLVSEGKRLREIRNALSIPIKASLEWSFRFFEKKFLSVACRSSLEFQNGEKTQNSRSLTLDCDNMTLAFKYKKIP